MYTEFTEPTPPQGTLRFGSIAGPDYDGQLDDATTEIDPDSLVTTSRQQDLDSTIVTVDYFVKDLITETDVEVMARNLMRGSFGDQFRNLISDCLDVYVFAVSNRKVANTFYNRLLQLYQVAYQGLDPSLIGVPWVTDTTRFSDYLRDIARYAIDFDAETRGQPFENHVIISAPTQIRRVEKYQERYVEEQFIRTNSQFERYGQSNDLFEKLPGKHIFNIDDLAFDNCDNLSIISFSRFDFQRLEPFLSLSGINKFHLNNQDLDFFSTMVSHPTHDIVTRSGKIKSEAKLFLDKITRAPYSGPVHFMGGPRPGYMTGFIHEDGSRDLDLVTVPVTKIQDFRKMQRTKMVNFEPPEFGAVSLDSAGNPVTPQLPPEIAYLEKRNKNYFDLAFVYVDYKRDQKETDMTFMFGLESIYKNNSKYYEFLQPWRLMDRTARQFVSTFDFTYRNLLDLRSIRVLRKRVSRREIGTTRLGSAKRKDFIPYEEPIYSVVYRSSVRPGRINGTTMSQNQMFTDQARPDRSRIRFRDNQSLQNTPFDDGNWMDWYAKDSSDSLMSYHGTGAVLQYGIEVTFVDRTKEILSLYLEHARACITQLENLSATLREPVFKQSEMWDIAVHNFFIPKKIGYYDFATNSFINNAEQLIDPANLSNPSIDEIIDGYMTLVQLSFGATSVNVSRSSVNILQRDDSDLFGNQTLMTLIDEGLFSFAEIRPIFLNMLNPRNSNPELFDSFVKQFKDTLEQVEDFLDLQDYNNPDAIYGGAGYTAKGNNHFTVQRWFNTVNSNPVGSIARSVDDDNFVFMDPDESRLYYDYEPRRTLAGTLVPADLGTISLNPGPGGDQSDEFVFSGVSPNGIHFGETHFNFIDRSEEEAGRDNLVNTAGQARGGYIDRSGDEERRGGLSEASFDAPPGTSIYGALNRLVEQINIRRNQGRDVQDVINSIESAGTAGATDLEMEGILASLAEELRDNAVTPRVGFVFQNAPENEQKEYGDLCDLIDNSDEPYVPPDLVGLQFGGGGSLSDDRRGGSITRSSQRGTIEFGDTTGAGTQTLQPAFDMRIDGQRILGHVVDDGVVEPLLSDQPVVDNQSYVLMNIEGPLSPMIPEPRNTVSSTVVNGDQSRTVSANPQGGSNSITGGGGADTITGGGGADTITGGAGGSTWANKNYKQSDLMKKLSKIAAATGKVSDKKPVKKVKESKKTFNLSGNGLENGFAKLTGNSGADTLPGGNASISVPPTASRTIPRGTVSNITSFGGGY